jgi:hypothetical protein
MQKIGKNITNLLRKTAVVLGVTMPLAFAGCKKPEEPPVVKALEQYMDIKNDENHYLGIEYSANLSNVDKAKLEVKKEGVLISSEEISDHSYKKSYPKAAIGNYEFILTSDNLKKDNYITVPDPLPDLGNVALNSNENSIATVSISAKDQNFEQNPVSIASVKSLDNKTRTYLRKTSNGYDLDVACLPTQSGAYQLEFEFKNALGELEKKVIEGNIIKDEKIDYTGRPDKTTKNYYGSGKIVNPFDNQPISESDLNRLIEVANGSFTDDNDKRLRDRCDVNGDGYVNLADIEMERKRVNGAISYLQGEVEKLPTRAAKEDWYKKMFEVYQVDAQAYFPEGDCNQFTDQTYIDFYGVEPSDIPKFQEVYKNYNFTRNRRFNLPALEVVTQDYDSNGIGIGGHAVNAFIFGNPSLTFDNITFFSSETNQYNFKLGEGGLIGMNANLYVRGPPILGVFTFPEGKKVVSMTNYVGYNIKDKSPTLKFVNANLINPGGK